LLKVSPVPRLNVIVLFSVMSAGCVGDLVEITNNPKQTANDMGGTQQPPPSPPPDLSTGQQPPPGPPPDLAGGSPQTVHFDPTIQNDIDNLGCSGGGCHGGTQTPVLLHAPTSTTDKMNNLTSFISVANAGENSPALQKNLAGDMISHAGGKPFQSASDPVYVRWLAWIQAGNPP
jgi:hypothetical protein